MSFENFSAARLHDNQVDSSLDVKTVLGAEATRKNRVVKLCGNAVCAQLQEKRKDCEAIDCK